MIKHSKTPFLALALILAACGKKDESTPTQNSGPLYAVMYEVYDDTSSNSYLSLLNTLDVETIDISKAIEYGGGRAFIQAYNGWLFVGDAAAPTVTRYSFGDGGELVAEGMISFANYGLDAGQFDSWNVTFISATKAYLLDFGEGTTIIWNPSTMEILGDIPAPAELRREGWSLEGSPAVVRGGRLFRAFDWANYDDASYAPDFRLATYDPVAGAIMRSAPEPCVLRIDAGTDGFAADQETDPWAYVGSLNWEIWSVDLASKTGAPIEGFGLNGGAYTPVQFDDRLLLMVPGGAEESYATQIFEVVGGRAEPKVKLPGAGLINS